MRTALSKPSLLLLRLLILAVSSAAISSTDIVADLLSLQSQSSSGIIRLNDDSVSRLFINSANKQPPRPRGSFSLLIFFDAVHLHDQLPLKDLRHQFGLVASSYIRNNNQGNGEGKIFFCDIDFLESQTSFRLFGVDSLPHIRFVGPDALRLSDSEKIEGLDFDRLADSIAEYVQAKTGFTVGPIHRPPILSQKQVAFVLLVLVISTPFAVKKVITGKTFLHDKKLWLLGSMFVYFFSVSGSMHNIIRKVPMFMVDRNDPSRLIFFYQGKMQLGAEGFAVGFLYTIVGLLLAFVTHVLIRVRSKNMQALFTFLALGISFWAVNQVVILNMWKTGNGYHDD